MHHRPSRCWTWPMVRRRPTSGPTQPAAQEHRQDRAIPECGVMPPRYGLRGDHYAAGRCPAPLPPTGLGARVVQIRALYESRVICSEEALRRDGDTAKCPASFRGDGFSIPITPNRLGSPDWASVGRHLASGSYLTNYLRENFQPDDDPQRVDQPPGVTRPKADYSRLNAVAKKPGASRLARKRRALPCWRAVERTLSLFETEPNGSMVCTGVEEGS